MAGALLLFLGGAPPAKPAEACAAVESVTLFGNRIDPAIELSVDNLSAPPTAGYPLKEVAWYKALFQIQQDDTRPWRITVYDGRNHVLVNFSAVDLRSGGGKRWTGVLPADSEVVLEAPADSPVRVSIPTLVLYPPKSGDTRFYSTQASSPAWRGLYNIKDEVPQKVGAAVGMIVASSPSDSGFIEWCCTGVMVSKDVMLTNYHCGAAPGVAAWNTAVCPNMVIDLAHDDRDVRQQYSCAEVLAKDLTLDYALIRIRPVAGGSEYVGEPVFRSLAGATAVSATEIFTVHHAQCQTKLLSPACRSELRSATNRAEPTEFAHTCDTEPGASGAPIFDDQGRLMGLHHRGFLRTDDCQPVNNIKRNYAIPISLIVADLRKKSAALARELGVDAN